MITDIIFAQYKPGVGETATLYTVPVASSATGTLYIAAQGGYDIVSVQLIPATLMNDPTIPLPTGPASFILYNTSLVGWVPIYLQQLYINAGDSIVITSTTGDCAFTYTGELFS